MHDAGLNVAIVASGPSAAGLQLPAGCTVIAVNGAIEWLPRADYWFTLDLSPENMRRARNPRRGVRYVVADNRVRQEELPHAKILRRVEQHNTVQPGPVGSERWWLWRWSCALGLSEDEGAVHTGNSAYGALNLAYHLRPARIALFGVDGTQETKLGGGEPRSLAHLPLLFASAEPQLARAKIQVLNGSVESRITCFPRTLREVAERWITP